MTAITFDTRKVARNLKAAGFDEVQADAIVDGMADAFADTVATKADLTEVKADLKVDIAEVKAHVARLETAMWRAGITIAGVAVLLNKVLDWLAR